MVATVGSISIDLSTNTATFTQGFKKAASTVERESSRMSKAVGGFSKAAKGMGGMLTGFIGGIAGGVAVGALGSLSGALGKATQALSDFEAIGNQAKASGLGTDFFQALSFGAEQADIETETLNKSLETFAKNVGLAREGTGKLYSGLIKLNPELLKAVLTAGDQEQRLKLVADAMAGLANQTDKAALATAVFGQGGIDLIRVLDGGAAALDKMKEHARELGIIIPEDLIARAGELDDQLTTLQKVIDVNVSQALIHLAPWLVAGAEQMAKLAQQANAAAAAFAKFADSPSLETLRQALEAIGMQGESIDWGSRVVNEISAVINAAEPLGDTFEEVQANIARAQTELREFVDLAKTGGLEGDFGKGMEENINRLLDRLAALQERLIEVGKTAAAVGNTMGDAFLEFRALETRYARAGAGGGGGFPALPRVYHGTQLQGAGATLEVPDDVMDDVEAAIKEETEATKKAPFITGRYVETLDKNTAGYFSNLGSTINDGFVSLGSSISRSILELAPSALEAKTAADLSLGPGSWAGRRFTSTGGGGGTARDWRAVSLLDQYHLGGTAVGTQPITEATSEAAAINVVVNVKPVMEGTRLSAQSTAEIKQAASAGANAALRQFYGR